MPHTVAAIFENEIQANEAKSQLIRLGIPDEDIYLRYTGIEPDSTELSSQSSQDEGGISGFFKRLFGFEDEDSRASHYSRALSEGRCMVAVDAPTDDQADRAADVLQRCGALDVDENASGEAYGASGSLQSGGSTSSRLAGGNADIEGRAKIPVVEEDLQVGKRVYERGGVRVYARSHEIPVEEKIRLREEHAVVQRRPVDRPATEADLASLNKSGTLEVTERSEEPVVGKRVRVVEEVEVGKQVKERTDTVRDRVKKTDVHVEQMAARDSGIGQPGGDASTPSSPTGGKKQQR